jgi:hypothetical protein
MKTKIGMLFALAAAVLSLVAPTQKKEILKFILTNSVITNSR